MATVAISEFKAKCLALIDQVNKTGQPLYVTKRGKLVAQILPPPRSPKPKSWLGCMQDSVILKGDLVQPVVGEDDWEVLR